ncbi:tetrahydromethanopterin S-methyltransferase subunit B [Nocardia sp. GAS34]|uniref:bestrophin-like domain n=1 Tax=unclassified Nocardia TaxID=2637762 RepID=UPI003D213C06
MFTWLYALPDWLGFLIITGTLVVITCAGIALLRPFVQKVFGPEPGRNEQVTMVLTVGGVFYGLLLGLVAAATYQAFDAAQGLVSNEAAAVGTLYREVSAYPDPERGVLQKDLVDYTDNLLNVAFPGLQDGEDPPGGTAVVTRFQDHLLAFQPQTKAQEIVHAAAIEQFARFDDERRQRINASSGGLPNVLWGVIVLGAAVNLVLLCLFSLSTRGAHLLLGGLFAFFLGTMIFLIAALDYPFRGDLSVSPEPVETMYHNVMGH